jgi:hypothetical protein
MAMLVQIPRVGVEIVPTIMLGMEYLVRKAIGPSLVVGTLLGLILIATSSNR